MKKLYNSSAPSVIWRCEDLTPEEKIVLFNYISYTSKGNRKGNIDMWLLSYISGMKRTEYEKRFNSLIKKEYFKVSKSNCISINWDKIHYYATSKDWYDDGFDFSDLLGVVNKLEETNKITINDEDIKAIITPREFDL